MAAYGKRSNGWATTNGLAVRVDRPRLVRVGAAANDNHAPAITIARRLAFVTLGALAAVAMILVLR